MSRQPQPPQSFPEAFRHTRPNTGQNVTGDPAYPQVGPTPGHSYPPQDPAYSSQQHPSQYSPQQYSPQQYTPQQYTPQQYAPQQYTPQQYSPQQHSSLQLSPNPSRRSTLPTTPTYDHASLPSQAPAPPSLSTSYNPSFPVPVRHQPHTSGLPSSEPPPTAHRAATMPMPVPAPSHTASSTANVMRPQNAMHSPPQSGIVGPQSGREGYGYPVVHERTEGPAGNYSRQDFEQGREHEGEYMRERGPPTYFAAGTQHQELVRCRICRTVTTRAAAQQRGWWCNGHMGDWQTEPPYPRR